MFQRPIVDFVVMRRVLVAREVVMVSVGGVDVHCWERLLQLAGEVCENVDVLVYAQVLVRCMKHAITVNKTHYIQYRCIVQWLRTSLQ